MYKIIAIFDSLKHFEIPIKEYQKRLWKDLEIIQLTPSKKDSVDEIKKDETKRLIKSLEKEKWCKILLEIGGKTSSTENFLKFLETKKQNFWKIIFIIGWVHWLYPEMKQHIQDTFSLSLLTFPHNLALLNLLEQIYRIESIKSGKKYHY